MMIPRSVAPRGEIHPRAAGIQVYVVVLLNSKKCFCHEVTLGHSRAAFSESRLWWGDS